MIPCLPIPVHLREEGKGTARIKPTVPSLGLSECFVLNPMGPEVLLSGFSGFFGLSEEDLSPETIGQQVSMEIMTL